MYDFFCIIVCDTFAMRVGDRDRTDSICSANRCSFYLDVLVSHFIDSHIFPGLCSKPCCVCYRHVHLSFSETYFIPPSFWCSHANKKRKRKMLFMLQIYPTTQTVPDLRPTIFGFAVFHNLLVCLHLFFLGCIVSYLGLIECWA